MKIWKRTLLRLAVALLLATALHPCPLAARSILEAGTATVWKYLDDGSEPGATWRQAGFDDSKWKSGPAPLGYGEARLGTETRWGTNKTLRPTTTWFRRVFDAPDLKSGERLVILLCMDDGAIVYLNGKEVGRANLPKGQVGASTPALRDISDRSEGFYFRVPVSAEALRSGQKNVLAVEVHQAAPASDDLFFDLALKTLPAAEAAPKVVPEAKAVLDDYYKRHYVGPGVKVPDGFIDGGRHMQLDAEGRARSGREILLVDRAGDFELRKHLEFARSSELRPLPPLARTQRLAAYVDRLTTPPGGERWVSQTIDQITREFANKPLRIGDVLDQTQAGVCRHRSLFFKLLADEAGLKTALVRGNYSTGGPRGFPHAWNEVFLDDGRRLLVDVMHNGGQPKFPAVTATNVVAHYLKEDDTPWYGAQAAKGPSQAQP